MRNRSGIALAVLLCTAFALGAYSAMQGLDNDGSLTYQAALRQAQGQQMYRDFNLPYGYVAVWLLAGGLRLVPTGGLGVVLASGLLNAAACAMCYFIVLRLTRAAQLAQGAAQVSAVGFLPIFGTFHHDHLGFAFVLLGLCAYVLAPNTKMQALISGLCLALAFYCKQTMGLAGLLAYGLASLASLGWRNALRLQGVFFTGGYLAGHALVLAQIAWQAQWAQYWFYGLQLPALYAPERSPLLLLYKFIFPFNINLLNILTNRHFGALTFYPFVGLCYVAYAILYRHWPQRAQAWYFALVFSLAATLGAAALVARNFSQMVLGLPIVMALVLHTLGGPRALRWAVPLGFTLISFAFLVKERRLLWPATDAYTHTQLWPIAPRQMYAPTTDSAFHAANVRIVGLLQSTQEPYAVVGEIPHLIPLALGRAPVQATVHYSHLLTVPVQAPLEQHWANDMIASLEKGRAAWIVLHQGPTEFRIRGFSLEEKGHLDLFKSYLRQHYTPADTIGGYLLLRQKRNF